MTEGVLPVYFAEGNVTPGFWVEGKLDSSWLGSVLRDRNAKYLIEAYRCPQCGLVQLYATQRLT
jgi:hypothetical protein